MELGIGLGYAPHEFRAFGFPVSRRVSLTEECVDILKLAWSGESFNYDGKRYHFDNVRVTPDPVQPGGTPLWMASTSPASADRAVRYDTNLLPQGVRSIVLDRWRDKTRAAGRDPDGYRIGIIRNVFVTDDKERDWPPLRDAERYRMGVYARFFEAAGLTGQAATFNAADRIPQRTIIGDVDHCVEELTSFIRAYGLTDVVTWGSAPGVQPATMTPMMERFVTEVAPRVRSAIEG